MAENQNSNEIVIQLSSYDRTPKDLGRWKQALQAAEDPDYPDYAPLMNLYHDILLDGHLTAITEKRINNILNTAIQFASSGKENEIINNLIESEAFELALRYIIESRLFGYSLCWVDITCPGEQSPKTKLIDRRHVVPPLHIYKYKDSDSNNNGIDYTENPYPAYTLTAGMEKDLGLLLKCAPYVLIKRGSISDWATFAEIFGMPLRVGKYPVHDVKSRDEMGEALDASGSAASMMIPDTTTLEFVENKSSTTGGGVHSALIDFCNKEMSKIILANTMTIDAEGGNYKGEVHAESEDGVLQADRRFALRILNTKFKELLEIHGYNPGDGRFSIPDKKTTSLKDRIEIDKKLSEEIEIPPEYWYETYKIPAPKGGAKAKQKSVVETTHAVSKKESDNKDEKKLSDNFFQRLNNFFD